MERLTEKWSGGCNAVQDAMLRRDSFVGWVEAECWQWWTHPGNNNVIFPAELNGILEFRAADIKGSHLNSPHDISPAFHESWVITATAQTQILHLHCISGCHGKGPPSRIYPARRGNSRSDFCRRKLKVWEDSCVMYRSWDVPVEPCWDFMFCIHHQCTEQHNTKMGTASLNARTAANWVHSFYFLLK